MDNSSINWEMFFFNVGCSLLASLFFLFVVLFFFKPKLRIAPFICCTKLEFDGDTKYYVFKIVNRSLFSAYDVKAELSLLRKYPTPPSGMMNTRFTPLSLAMSEISNIPSRRPEWIRKGAEHAIRLRTVENLTKLLEDEYCSIELRISLRHGLTGLSRVIKREFSHVSEIKHSNFTYGSRFATLN